MFGTMVSGLAAIMVVNQFNYSSLHKITTSTEYKGASVPHTKQATNGADTKLLTDIQRVTNATQTAVIQMNNSVTTIKTASIDNADIIEAINATANATGIDTA
jgi:hypothetical protein